MKISAAMLLEIRAALVIIVVVRVVVMMGVPVPASWRARYRYWENRPVFWPKPGRQYARSARVTERQRRVVFAADRHRCVMRSQSCRGGIQVDHIRPWSCGGRTRLWNLMTLCRYHNVTVKSNYWPGVFYRGSSIVEAVAVLAAERRARWNPLRWARAGLPTRPDRKPSPRGAVARQPGPPGDRLGSHRRNSSPAGRPGHGSRPHAGHHRARRRRIPTSA